MLSDLSLYSLQRAVDICQILPRYKVIILVGYHRDIKPTIDDLWQLCQVCPRESLTVVYSTTHDFKIQFPNGSNIHITAYGESRRGLKGNLVIVDYATRLFASVGLLGQIQFPYFKGVPL